MNIWNIHHELNYPSLSVNIAPITLINPIHFVIKDYIAKFYLCLLMNIYTVYRDHMSMMCNPFVIQLFSGPLQLFLLNALAKKQLQLVGGVGGVFGEHFPNYIFSLNV